MDILRVGALILWILWGSDHVPTAHTNHHVDEVAEIHVLRIYGNKII